MPFSGTTSFLYRRQLPNNVIMKFKLSSRQVDLLILVQHLRMMGKKPLLYSTLEPSEFWEAHSVFLLESHVPQSYYISSNLLRHDLHDFEISSPISSVSEDEVFVTKSALLQMLYSMPSCILEGFKQVYTSLINHPIVS